MNFLPNNYKKHVKKLATNT